jgi:hypothetical protein
MALDIVSLSVEGKKAERVRERAFRVWISAGAGIRLKF